MISAYMPHKVIKHFYHMFIMLSLYLVKWEKFWQMCEQIIPDHNSERINKIGA